MEKDAFRALAIAGESKIGHGPPGAMSPVARSLLERMPVGAWRAIRQANHERFEAAFGSALGVEILTRGAAAPFVVTLALPDAALRTRVQKRLVSERIYVHVLWELSLDLAPGMPERHVDLSRRLLSLHCDHRYRGEDMARVADAMRRAVLEA